MAFVQLIEFKSDRIDEMNALLDEWLKVSAGWRTHTRAVETKDRDAAGTYVQIVEFPSYEAAMENSKRPETGEFAKKLEALCKAPPTFRNLDVMREE
jgi:hypothetical protein